MTTSHVFAAAHAANLSYGNQNSGAPLPDALRSALQQSLKTDLGQVRLHESTLPTQYGAKAVTHGTDIYFAPAQYNPQRQDSLWLLAHEAAHVAQQLSGRVGSTAKVDGAPRLTVDPGLEADADAFADRFVTGHEFGPCANSEMAPQAGPDWSVLLPNLWINEGGNRRKLTSTSNTMIELENKLRTTPVYNHFIQNRKEIQSYLRSWINSSRHTLKRFIFGQRENIREYKSWENLARALIGEVRSEGNLQKETELAKQTEKSGYINWYLNNYISYKLYRELNKNSNHDKVKIAVRTKNPYKGEYSHFYKNMGKILYSPEKYDFKSKVAVIHDITKVMAKVNRNKFAIVPPEKVLFTALVPLDDGSWAYQQKNMGTGGFRVNQPAKKFGNNDHCTLLETSEVISAARYNDMPVEMGPSFTCGRMMQMVHGCGGSVHHLTAVAWGIFAFWNLHYSHKYSRVHRFHGTLDMAKNYGVAYTPFVYPNNAPTW